MTAEPSTTELPNWSKCAERSESLTATALERFIYDNEPAGPCEVRFRAGLAAVLHEARRKFESEEYHCSKCAALPPSASHDAIPVSVLKEHWLTGVECDHATGTDVSTCFCGRWRSEARPSIPAAVESWIEHLRQQHAVETGGSRS